MKQPLKKLFKRLIMDAAANRKIIVSRSWMLNTMAKGLLLDGEMQSFDIFKQKCKVIRLGVGTISPIHGRLSQKYPCDPKVNSPKGFLPTSNTQLAPERLCLPAPKISARQTGPLWC